MSTFLALFYLQTLAQYATNCYFSMLVKYPNFLLTGMNIIALISVSKTCTQEQYLFSSGFKYFDNYGIGKQQQQQQQQKLLEVLPLLAFTVSLLQCTFK